MREWLLTLFSLSLSGSLTALALFAAKPLVRLRLSQSWQYYIWLVVLLRLLIPLGPEGNLMQRAADQLGGSASDTAFADAPLAQPPVRHSEGDDGSWQPVVDADREAMRKAETGDMAEGGCSAASLPLAAGGLWLGVALALLLRKGLAYAALTRELRQRSIPCADPGVLRLCDKLCGQLGIGRPPAVLLNSRLPSPMLVGLFCPFVALPEEFPGNPDLRFVLHHELVHLKRRDIFYKWAVQLAVCVHWFNPIVHLVAREIGRSCELACDEAVVRRVGEDQKISYGEAILSAVRPEKAPTRFGMSLSMSKDKQLIKERLTAIMKHNKRSAWTVCCSILLSMALLCGAAYAGAYKAPAAAVPASPPVEGAVAPDLATATILGETWSLIDTEEQLRGLGRGDYPLDGKYLLNADIQLDRAVDWIPIGTAEAPFTGVFDGNGFEIEGLTITNKEINVIGMFAWAQNAEIHNVTLRGPDIEGAFTPGNTIGPILAFGINCSSHDNRVIDPVERDASETGTGRYLRTASGYKSRTDSLVEAFAPYAAHGVLYSPEQDLLTYKGEPVKLFVVFKPYREEGMTYAFDLCYQGKDADSTLYLEAVRDGSGAVTAIHHLDSAVGQELLAATGGLDMPDDTASRQAAPEGESTAPKREFQPVTMDASTIFTELDIVARDIPLGAADRAVSDWTGTCAAPGAYVRKSVSSGVYTTTLYYNAGGRYPWTMGVEGGKIIINLYSDSHLATADGYHLMYFTAPRDYADITLYLDGVEIPLVDAS